MKNRAQSERWHAAKQKAADSDISMTYFEHEGDPRLRFSYGGVKAARQPLDAIVSKDILSEFFPKATVLSEDVYRIVVRLVP